jgi:hypothetical protein
LGEGGRAGCQGIGVYFSIIAKLPEFEKFLPRSQRSQIRFYAKALFLTSFFDGEPELRFDGAVDFSFKVFRV